MKKENKKPEIDTQVNVMSEIDKEKLEKLTKSLNTIKNKKSKFLFCVPTTNQPSALIYEIYFHIKVLKGMGFDVFALTEDSEYVIPDYIESELTKDVEHVSMTKSKLSVSPEDFMIIPELFTNIMEQTKNLPCKRIGLLQSIDFMLNSLIPGVNWKSFGINDVITTSNKLKDLSEEFFGKNSYNIKSYNIGIPDYFNRDDKPQKPIISVIGRNANEISKIVKLFYSKYPHFNWITFDPMLTKQKPPQPMNRMDFAKRLKGNFAAVWVDRIASFGTFPVECLKSGVIPICLKPDITPEYVLNEKGEPHENIGYWTTDIYDIPNLINNAISNFLDDNIPDETYDGMAKVVEKYNQENSQKQLVNIYNELISDREKVFEQAITEFKENK